MQHDAHMITWTRRLREMTTHCYGSVDAHSTIWNDISLTTAVSPSSWVKQRTAVAAWWKTWRNSQVRHAFPSHRELRTQLLLLENEEDSVNKLEVFDVVVDHVEGDSALFGQSLFLLTKSQISQILTRHWTRSKLTLVKALGLQMAQKKPCLK